MKHDLVITGAAAIGAHGFRLGDLDAALRAGVAVVRPPPPSECGLPRRCGAVCGVPDGLDLTEWVPPRVARRMSAPSRFTVAAGRMALAEAGIVAGEHPDALATCVATCFGPSNFTKQLLVQILRDSPRAASPFLFTDCVANAPCGQLAIAVDARGANTTVVQREAGPLAALAQACRDLDRGRAAIVVVGAVDEIDEYQSIILDRMGALAPDAASLRPFDAARRGTLLGEGAGCVVVETAAGARRRSAPVRARVVSTCRAFDPTARPANWGRGGAALAARLCATLQADGIAPASIDAVVSGASGARDGDRLEAEVLHAVFGAAVPPVLVPKAVIGEYGGGTLVPAVLSLEGGTFARPAGFSTTDLGITPFAGALPAPARVLVSALASGGAACWAVLERP